MPKVTNNSSLLSTSKATLTSNRKFTGSSNRLSVESPSVVGSDDRIFVDNSDAVFGVKTSLIVEPTLVKDSSRAKELGFGEGKEFWELKKDYVLLTTEQAEEQKKLSLRNYYASLQQ